jgi:hypothetical protein
MLYLGNMIGNSDYRIILPLRDVNISHGWVDCWCAYYMGLLWLWIWKVFVNAKLLKLDTGREKCFFKGPDA